MSPAAAAAAAPDVTALTELHAIQALLADTIAQERALDAELEALLAKRVVRACAGGGAAAALHARHARRTGRSAARSPLHAARRLAAPPGCCAGRATGRCCLRARQTGSPLPSCCGALLLRANPAYACARAPRAPLRTALAQELADTLGGLDAATEVLEVVTADAEHVAASVAGTCALAERVSGKARGAHDTPPPRGVTPHLRLPAVSSRPLPRSCLVFRFASLTARSLALRILSCASTLSWTAPRASRARAQRWRRTTLSAPPTRWRASWRWTQSTRGWRRTRRRRAGRRRSSTRR
jgi:hypothetical protein